MSRDKQINITKSGEYMRMYNADPLKGEERRRKSAQRAKEWRDRNPEYRKQIQDRSYDKIRRECLSHYGGGKLECRCCKEGEIKFLHLDHKNGDGAERRKEWEKEKTTIFGGTGFYYWLKKNGYPDLGLQVLCANCNLGKRTGKYCPHESRLGIDMDGKIILVEELPKTFPRVTRRLKGEAEEEAKLLGVSKSTLRMRRWREKKLKN